ncbi:MAG: phospho-N-acetylmuramoyl-pentapeptide-transferase [Bradymonadia bacterium]|jgi:phospho-N-acetylmuramoyl-pentapeptide-transferase
MFFHLFEAMREQIGPLNVFRYPSFRIIVALITSLSITYSLYPWFIRKLKERQIGQVVRDDLEGHENKKDTPTMGGILLIFAVAVSTLMWSDLRNPLVWVAVGVTLLFATVGFIDDVMKLGARGSKGLSERGKLLGQFSTAFLALGLIAYGGFAELDTTLYFPFVSVDRFTLELPTLLYVLFGAVVMVGSSNAVNLTDGLDGLAIGPVITGAGTFAVLAYASAAVFTVPGLIDGAPAVIDGQTVYASFDVAGYLKIPHVLGAQELAIFCASIVGAGIGFLWYNTLPAQVFMGDVGSLGLGGALGTVAVLTKNELLSVIILGIFVLEALSVILQRYYFKATGGKRIFLMAPIHHHFERKNWSESQIVVRFWIISILLCLVALASLKLR